MSQKQEQHNTLIRFTAIDTLFFRESRPMESAGELQSVFPPSMRTLSGAIRSWIGEQSHVNWKEYKEESDHSLRAIIGSPDNTDDLGKLSFKGAWLSKNKQRYFPAPLHLMKKENDLFQLTLSDKGHHCDLGKNVRLPKLPNEDAKGSQSLENTWISQDVLSAVLQGKKPAYNEKNFLDEAQFFERNSRVGIARDNVKRTVKEGLLYQTQHIRPKQDVSIEVDIKGLPDKYQQQNSIIHLGGEGRAASLQIEENHKQLPKVDTSKAGSIKGLIIYLLTPLQITQENNQENNVDDSAQWQPLPLFKKHEEREQTTYWQGVLNNIELKLHGAITGKALREGGWDMANHCPRVMKSLIPAGSVFYCEATKGDNAEAIRKLHDTQIGELQQYGYGHIAVGIWK